MSIWYNGECRINIPNDKMGNLGRLVKMRSVSREALRSTYCNTVSEIYFYGELHYEERGRISKS
jgi:hypothetical protein